MAGSMFNIATRCFPRDVQIVDCFHVQKLMYGALQSLRVEYRWQAFADENKEIQRSKDSGDLFIPTK